jgi:ankyrin repeat protein
MDNLLAQCRELVPQKNIWGGESVRKTLTKRPDLVKLVEEIEKSGDSSVIFLVKNWPRTDSASQLQEVVLGVFKCGAELSVRDRNGDTALAIAAKRGLRPMVLRLLGLNANPNSRDYQGNGILSQATKCLLQTQTDTKRYAGVLSCMALLTDHGAKANPTAYDEWSVVRVYGNSDEAFCLSAMRENGFISGPII